MNAGSSKAVKSFAVFLSCLLMLLVSLTSGCGDKPEETESTNRTDLVFATTTSVQDSGILDAFVEKFESEYPYNVKGVAVGSGAALFMGMNGDACVLLTHEPNGEKQFMDGGYGESIDKVMHNDFIIIGPSGDPAGIRGLEDPAEAVKKISETQSPFVSRGDASGTHAMELSMWERADLTPGGEWYTEAGQSMGATIRIAEEKQAYTLTDRATFIVLEEALDLEIMVEGDPGLINQYSVTVVNPENNPGINHEGALSLREFLLSEETKELIEKFGWDEYKKHLFYPD